MPCTSFLYVRCDEKLRREEHPQSGGTSHSSLQTRQLETRPEARFGPQGGVIPITGLDTGDIGVTVG